MKCKNNRSSELLIKNKKIPLYLGIFAFSCVLPIAAYAQENIDLVPAQDASDQNQIPLDLEDDKVVGAEVNNKAKENNNIKVSNKNPEADDLLPEDGLAPAANSNGDEFSFDDSVEYEKSPEDVAAGFRKQAFDNALGAVMPMKPEEIRSVLEHYDRTVQSTEVPVHPYPRPELTVQNVALDPGSPPLVVKLSYGYVTTLSILDVTSAPWPIEDISWVGDFEIHEESSHDGQDVTPKTATHMLRISPSSNFAHGNVSMRLMGLQTPVILTFETNRDVVDYRFDAVLPIEGPNSKTPIIDPGPTSSLTLTSGDIDMSQALGGIVPKDAKRLLVSGVDGRTTAYNYNGLTYVRTPLALLSPGWESSVASADGTRVYALQESPVLILSDKGRMVRAHLSEVGGER